MLPYTDRDPDLPKLLPEQSSSLKVCIKRNHPPTAPPNSHTDKTSTMTLSAKGEQNMPSQNVSFWHTDYTEQIIFKQQQTREKL